MKLPTALIAALALSGCVATGPVLRTPPPEGTEARFVARGPGGEWVDEAPLAGLEASTAANCATTSKGAACVLSGGETGADRSLATVREGRCLASWSSGAGTTGATVELHRNAFPTPRGDRFERLYYALNSGRALDVTPRLADPAAFTRLCDQLLQPDVLMKRVHD